MSNLVVLQEPRPAWELPLTKPLDEAVWRTWIAKGLDRDRRSRASLTRATAWVSIAGLVAVAVIWQELAPYHVVARFIVTAGAMAAMFQALSARRYPIAAVFGALAVLYNPVAPQLGFSSDWQRAVVGVSAIPFVALLFGHAARRESNV